ncbi:MAG: hypothetical protein AAF252_07750, partial [Pseudomonadota bacterium]
AGPVPPYAFFRDLPPSPKSGITGQHGQQGVKTPSVASEATGMVRLGLACAALLVVSACGGARLAPSSPPSVLFATGPIQQACQADRRKQSSRARCGCVQAVADQSLSASDQRRGAGYFKNPQALQDVRQNQDSNASNRRFWAAWKAYGQAAAAACSGT